jgi:hypothetical protein
LKLELMGYVGSRAWKGPHIVGDSKWMWTKKKIQVEKHEVDDPKVDSNYLPFNLLMQRVIHQKWKIWGACDCDALGFVYYLKLQILICSSILI